MGHLYWLSFVEPQEDRFLGVVIVRGAADLLTAVQVSHALGLNPGGEVRGMLVDRKEGIAEIPEGYIERLLTRDDVNKLMEAVGSPERF